MKSNTVYKFILTLGLLSSVVVLSIFTFQTMDKKVESIKVQSHKDSQNKNLEFGNQLRNNMSDLLAQESIIKNSFIASSDVLGFIRSIEETAVLRGLQISIDKVDKKKEVPLATKGIMLADSEFTIQVKGSYDQVLLFIEDLTNNDKKLLLNQVNMYRSDNEGTIEYTTQIILTGIMLSYE